MMSSASKIFFLILVLAYYSRETTAQGSLDFTFKLSGVELRPVQSGWGVDGFVKVYLDGVCKGRSETIKDSRNPNWRYLFKVPFTPGRNQILRIEVRHNNEGSKDDALGDGYVNLDSYFDNPVTLYRDGSTQGKVRIQHDMMPNDEVGGDC